MANSAGKELHDGKEKDVDAGVDHETGIPIDKGWAWMLVVGSFSMHFLCVGPIKSFGVLFGEFQEKYGVAAWALNTVISLPLCIMFLLGIVGNTLAARYSSFTIVFIGCLLSSLGILLTAFMPHFIGVALTFGLMSGIGYCFCFGPSIVMVNRHFSKYRSLANGISVSGSGIGSLAVPNLMRVLLREFGLQGCLLILSGISLNLAVCAMLFRKQTRKIKSPPTPVKIEINPAETGKRSEMESLMSKDNKKTSLSQRSLEQSSSLPIGSSEMYSVSMQALNDLERCEPNPTEKPAERRGKLSKLSSLLDWSLVYNPVFLIYGMTCFLATPGYGNVFFMLPNYAEENGQDPDSSALITSIIGISDLVGRLFFGWLSDLNLYPKRWGFIVCIFLTGVLNMVIPSITSFAGMVTYAGAFGFFGGSYITLIAVLLSEDLGIEKLGSSFGLTMLLMGVSILAGPPICGSLRDTTGSWDASFYFIAALTLIGSALPIFLPYVNGRNKKDEADAE